MFVFRKRTQAKLIIAAALVIVVASAILINMSWSMERYDATKLKIVKENQQKSPKILQIQQSTHNFLDDAVAILKLSHGPRFLKDIPLIQSSGNYFENLVVLTTATASFIDFTENWLASIKRLHGDRPVIYIIAEDQETYDHFYKKSPTPKVHIFQAPQYERNSTLIFDTNAYKNFVNKRPQYILDILRRGYNVLFSDVDIVWLDAPYKYFEDNFDIYILQDQGPPRPTIFNAGFVMYRATNATMQFVERWIDEINHFKEPKPDQELLNRLLQKKPAIKRPVPNISFKVLDSLKFISGRYYFNETWRSDQPNLNPVVVHNNWIKGHDIKVERFREHGMWFILNADTLHV